MSQTLEQRVSQLQRHASHLVWVSIVLRLAATILAVLLGLGLVDFLLRLQDPIGRWLLSAAAISLSAWTVARLVGPVLKARQSAVAVARRIERCFPELGERLSTAIALVGLPARDPAGGSPALRQAVLAEAEAAAVRIDFRNAVDARPVRQAAFWAAVAAALAGLVALASPSLAGLAVARLATPWQDRPWPRRHELAFVERPQHLAAGDDFEVAVIDRRGKLPDSVQLLLQFQTPAGLRLETRAMKPLGDRMVLRIENVRETFAYRARGGDDDTMPWTEMEVIEPPKVVQWSVQVEPPPYSGLAPHTASRIVKGLAGSKLRLAGRFDKPIRSLAAKSDSPDFPVPAVELAADGTAFHAGVASPWILERSGVLWIEFADQHGLVFGRDMRLDLQAISDLPPTIAWETPTDDSFVTPQALVPIRALVKDDLAVRRVELRTLRPAKSDDQDVIVLYEGTPPQPDGQPSQAGPRPDGQTLPIDYAWDLSRLPELREGDELSLRIIAEDFKPQLSMTSARRLIVIAAEELASRLAARQRQVLHQIADALRQSRQGWDQLSSLQARLQSTQRLAAGDLHQLQAGQHNQHELQRLLGPGREGAEGQIAALLDELASSRIDDQALRDRLRELLGRLRHLNREPLPAIDQHLTEAIKAARQTLDAAATTPVDVSAVTTSLHAAAKVQSEVVAALEEIVGALRHMENIGRLEQDIAQVHADQQRLADQTAELRSRTLAAAQISPDDRDAARLLSQFQAELARQVEKLQLRLDGLLRDARAADPRAADALAAANEAARKLAIAGQMRQAAVHLRQLELGQALEGEQAALQALEQLRDILASQQLDRDEASIAGQPGEMPPSAKSFPIAELKRIKALQEEINRRTTQLQKAQPPDGPTAQQQAELATLAREQAQLAELTARMASEIATAPAPNDR